ncbi:hypothetical protein JY651_26390 [Pyxidicoccus parkwayensis]|uniref:Lipoprotein n=1 Tax=Pyxidicoccus parkwayensis TaxID=2813578 RepID=A0ABX7NJ35_9BACT|nr:hypothetical protein [Pyxidicoccus parkwaysis]QSQ18887.1 hypothetical protein JY651_26390 [Pyxidicoccus parkwaysis]
MRHPFQTLGLLVLVCAGCDRLQEDPIFAYGLAQQRDGAPLAGATLSYERAKVEKRPNNGGSPRDYPHPMFTLYGTTTTEGTGDYFLEMRYGDVQAVDPSYPGATIPYRYRVSLLEEDGAGTFVSFVFQDDVELPLLKTWDARLTATPGPDGFVVSFAEAPPTPEVPVTGELANVTTPENAVVPGPPSVPDPVLILTSGGQPLFRAWGATSPWTVSPYVLEDFASPELQLRALSIGEWTFFPTGALHSTLDFRQEWRTGVLPLPAGNLRPISRGIPCEPAPEPGGPCPWTDGRLEPVPVKTPLEVPWLILTLPEPTRLRHAVVRGMGGSYLYYFILEGSLDGEQWSRMALAPLLMSEDPVDWGRQPFTDQTQWDSPFDGGLTRYDSRLFGESALEDVGPVRYVRLTGTSYADGNNGVGRFIYQLAEVSLFE